MKFLFAKTRTALLTLLLITWGGLTHAQSPQPLNNVRGNWIIYSKNIDGGKTVTKSVQLSQNGSRITGHFKGPNQSGGVQGTLNGNHIEFSTRTREVLTFRGEVKGDTMSGLYGLKGRHAEWSAVRSN